MLVCLRVEYMPEKVEKVNDNVLCGLILRMMKEALMLALVCSVSQPSRENKFGFAENASQIWRK